MGLLCQIYKPQGNIEFFWGFFISLPEKILEGEFFFARKEINV
jgi:hypothetical protein